MATDLPSWEAAPHAHAIQPVEYWVWHLYPGRRWLHTVYARGMPLSQILARHPPWSADVPIVIERRLPRRMA